MTNFDLSSPLGWLVALAEKIQPRRDGADHVYENDLSFSTCQESPILEHSHTLVWGYGQRNRAFSEGK